MIYEDEEKRTLAEELTEEEIDQVVGGAVFITTDTYMRIEWVAGQKMCRFWEDLDRCSAFLHDWGINSEEVKGLIRVRAKEEMGTDSCYYATISAHVYLYPNGTIR